MRSVEDGINGADMSRSHTNEGINFSSLSTTLLGNLLLRQSPRSVPLRHYMYRYTHPNPSDA
jgi:hypothetical protein